MCNQKSYIFGAECNDNGCWFKVGSMEMTIWMSGGRRILVLFV
ncbi:MULTISPECIES: hypothetical protein [Okeania]|nr:MULTISPECIES: hypothetical protein [Okeania]